MKLVVLLFFCLQGCQLCFAQDDSNDAAVQAQMKKIAEEIQKIPRDSLMKNPGLIQKMMQKMNHITDSLKNAATRQVEKEGGADGKKIAAAFLSGKAGDTSYVYVNFHYTKKVSGQHVSENDYFKGTTTRAPMVWQNGIFSLYVEGNTGFDTSKYVRKTGGDLPMLTYIRNRESLVAEGHAMRKETSQLNGKPSTTMIQSTSPGGTAGFAFRYDTITGATGAKAGIGLKAHEHTDSYGSAPEYRHFVNDNDRMYDLTGGNTADQSDMIKTFKDSIGDHDAPPVVITRTRNGFRVSWTHSFTQGEGEYAEHTVETFNANIVDKPVQYEAIIKPVQPKGFSYEHWLPRGPKTDGSDDTKGDDSLQFYIVVRDKNDTTKIMHNYTVSWRLGDLSHYPGFCNNYPAHTVQPNTDPDLTFHKDMKQDPVFETDMTDTSARTKEGKGEQGRVKINCMDYAAYGQVIADVTLDDGTHVDGQPYYQKGIYFISIPYDKDGNKVADYWEKLVGTYQSGHPLTWDGDDQLQQRESGDGYTLFEEYRGFSVKDNANYKGDHVLYKENHVRTDPKYKDCFIYDKDGLFKKYYGASNDLNAAQINWHYVDIDKGQIVFKSDDKLSPDHRWVNFNAVDKFTFARQYCVVLLKNAGTYSCPLDETGGTALGVTYSKKEFKVCQLGQNKDTVADDDQAQPASNSPVKNAIETVVYEGGVNSLITAMWHNSLSPGLTAQLKESIMGNNVRHEIGHYIGVMHHAKTMPASPDSSCAWFPDENGVLDCPMRAPNDDEAQSLTKNLGPTPTAPLSPSYFLYPKKRYCKNDQQGYIFAYKQKVSAAGKPMTYTNGSPVYTITPSQTTAQDNCWGQITVKSYPD